MKKGNIIISVLIGMMVLAGGLFFATRTEAHGDGIHTTICHHTPSNQVTHTFHTIFGYFGHLGQPHSGSTYDTQGACEQPSPSPSPSPSPEPSPSPVPCEQTEEGCGEYCDDESAINYEEKEECRYEEEPSPTPTPEATPEATQVSGNIGTPQCSDVAPEKAPANFQVFQGTPNDGKLTVTWNWDTGANHGDRVFIAYGENQGDEKYGTGLITNDGTEEIGNLVNGQHYWFKIRYQNSCATGPWTDGVDPTP